MIEEDSMENIRTVIKATGHYVPDKIITNDDLSEIVDTNDEWIMQRTGIRERRIAIDENTSDLAAKAAKKILQNANMSAEEIDLILVATISGDYAMPSTACLVQSKIGAVNAAAFDITAACSGFIYALTTAHKFVQSQMYQNVLVIGAEVLSKTIDWSDRGTCVLFGDGAAGVLVTAGTSGGVIAEQLGADGTGGEQLTVSYMPNANRFNGKERVMPSNMQMDGRAIFKFATKTLSKKLEEIIENSGMKKEEIDHIVLHQANDRIIQAVAKKTEIPLEKFYRNMYYYANTSSATIPIALSEMNEKGMLHKGDKILMSGFGGGLTWGSLIIEW